VGSNKRGAHVTVVDDDEGGKPGVGEMYTPETGWFRTVSGGTWWARRGWATKDTRRTRALKAV
jgi:hypothetical protein